MNIVNLIETVSPEVETSEGINDKLIESHYHKVRLAHRALALVEESIVEHLKTCICFLENNDLVVELDLLESASIDDIVNGLNSYQEENFTLDASAVSESMIKITVCQTFDGGEDEVLYGN